MNHGRLRKGERENLHLGNQERSGRRVGEGRAVAMEESVVGEMPAAPAPTFQAGNNNADTEVVSKTLKVRRDAGKPEGWL